jgi:hypothetical protein
MVGRPGPKTLYKPDEEAWLDSASNEHLALIRDKPSDTTAHKAFSDKKTEEFLTKFGDKLLDKDRGMEEEPFTNIAQWREVSGLNFSLNSVTNFHGQ